MVNCREDEMIWSLGKVTVRPREERVEDMNVKGRPFWVKVPTFHLKGKPQGLEWINHRWHQSALLSIFLCDRLLIIRFLDLTSNAHEDGVDESSSNWHRLQCSQCHLTQQHYNIHPHPSLVKMFLLTLPPATRRAVAVRPSVTAQRSRWKMLFEQIYHLH